MNEINQIDSKGRRQGIWLFNFSNKNVELKIYYLNGGIINYFQRFFRNGRFFEDEFLFEIF
jgi:antitoxin component YwqK of YwqJK toxin-antitoxin module